MHNAALPGAASTVLSTPFVVEVWGIPVGIVVTQGDRFRFHAITQSFMELDRSEFTRPGYARVAAARLHASQSPANHSAS